MTVNDSKYFLSLVNINEEIILVGDFIIGAFSANVGYSVLNHVVSGCFELSFGFGYYNAFLVRIGPVWVIFFDLLIVQVVNIRLFVFVGF